MTDHKATANDPTNNSTDKVVLKETDNAGQEFNSPEPPKGPPVWLLLLLIGGGVVGFIAGTFWGDTVKQKTDMVLKSVSEPSSSDGSVDDQGGKEETAETEKGNDKTQYYTCGMHPWVILPEPGTCPICHMELTPLDPDKFTGEIAIDPVMAQNIGVRVAEVISAPVVKTIRTVGTVDYDETSVRDINTKVSGWIEKLYVDYEGENVKAGDPLFDIYSPRLYTAQGEYLGALSMTKGNNGGVGSVQMGDASTLLEDARVQLEFFDLTAEQISELEKRGEPAKNVTILSPYDGVVIAKHANEGMQVNPGMQVFRLADLSKVWVMVTLYEYQLPYVTVGQEAIMTLPYIPGQEFKGRIIYIYPFLDNKTRQVQIRLEFDNPELVLKPGMYANVELKSTLAAERTQVPRSAIIDTGERQVAFVSLGEGKFEPRDVIMGVETDDDYVEVLDGLKKGEKVVVSGQFLLDSEARIRDSLARMIRGDLAAEQSVSVAVSGTSELTAMPEGIEKGVTSLINSYFKIGDLLANDTYKGAADPAQDIADTVDELLTVEIPGRPHFWHKHEEVATVRAKALEIAEDNSIDKVREDFADLSIALAKFVKATGVPDSFEMQVQELHCPMYRAGQGGSYWLQPAGDVRNPFFGSVMLECFDDRNALPVSGSTSSDVNVERENGERAGSAEASDMKSMQHGAENSREEYDKMISAYLKIQEKLTRNELNGIDSLLQNMRDAGANINAGDKQEAEGILGKLKASLDVDTSSLETFRQGFRKISDLLIELVHYLPYGNEVAPALYHVYCPMEKADWLQVGKDVRNPYAPDMLTCGTVKEEIPADSEGGNNK